MAAQPPDQSVLEDQLRSAIGGEVRFDRLARTLYATDAGIHEIIPIGVVFPRDAQDVAAIVKICRGRGVPIIPRGAGTGLAGGAVGAGVQIDFSRHMNRIDAPDLSSMTIRVQAGVVLDELNVVLAPHGVRFAPDVATSSRATIGGMIANNSCGARSVVYGRTVDHVAALTTVLADGSVVEWPCAARGRIQDELTRIIKKHRPEIEARFPKVMRSSGGYGLDRLCGDDPVDPIKVICGSEGTLCLVTDAVLRLTALPRCTKLLLVHFRELHDALAATPDILDHAPSAVELVDRHLLAAAARDPSGKACAEHVDLSAEAILIVEMMGDDAAEVGERIENLRRSLADDGVGYRHSVVDAAGDQHAVWEMRKRGLGLLMSRPGDVQSYAFVEDTAVQPARLAEYIERFQKILREEGVTETALYAHASVGEIHVRPAINLKTAEGVGRLRRIAERVSDLVLEFGGSNSGEHGDGLVRSCFLEKLYGARIMEAFGEVKRAFDPDGLFNPGKIVNAQPMHENLRFGESYQQRDVKTHLDFSSHGGMAGLAQMCSGVGQCRQRLTGVMCPSFMATGDETHTTRARANALRVALSNRGLLDGLNDAALDEVMSLCLMCKACKTECPTGVDMAMLKSEWMSQRILREGASRTARFLAGAPRLARLGSRFPRTTNWMLASPPVRAWLERRYGLDRRIAPPRLAERTFRHWFDRRSKARGSAPRVAYFVDTWTNYYTPQVGIAAVRLLEAAGFRVVVPDIGCCGRILISQGLLAEARHAAQINIERLVRFADSGTPIVGSEPSCLLTLRDEYPRLLPGEDADAVAGASHLLEDFLDNLLQAEPDRIRFSNRQRHLLYHAHCHQKALVGSAGAVRLLGRPCGYDVVEIDSGCCGMAGSFGHMKEHYDVARAIGEQRLFPAVRNRADAEVAVSGFSCREQIAHHTDVAARHLLEHLADALEH